MSSKIEYSESQLIQLAEDKISLGEKLQKELLEFDEIDGIKKLNRKISQELKFLRKVTHNRTIKINNLLCSNLIHFKSLIECLCNCENVVHVDYALPNNENRTFPLRVDIICDNGATWIKVIARNPKSLSDAVNGNTSYGSKTILDQAEEFVDAADKNPYMFNPPKVIFMFANKIDNDLIEALTDIGINIRIGDTDVDENNLNPENSSYLPNTNQQNEIKMINLDITTLLAYVSAMTNGSCNWIYKEPLLTEQAKWEKLKPVKPFMDELFSNKKIICCETAINSFNEILNMLGGPTEKERANEFLKKITVLPDIKESETPEEFHCIKIGGRIKPRSFQIFAFGVYHKALTVTSNEGFVRSMKMQGFDIPVILVQPRALTEQKERTAKLNLNQ